MNGDFSMQHRKYLELSSLPTFSNFLDHALRSRPRQEAGNHFFTFPIHFFSSRRVSVNCLHLCFARGGNNTSGSVKLSLSITFHNIIIVLSVANRYHPALLLLLVIQHS